MLEWLSINEKFINIQRLKTLNKYFNFNGSSVLPAIANTLMTPTTKTKWKLLSKSIPEKNNPETLFLFKNGSFHPASANSDKAFTTAGFHRKPFLLRGNATSFNSADTSNLILKLRAIFGVNSRSEIIAYLLTHDEGNATEIALFSGYFPKTIYNTMKEIFFSGKLAKRVHGREVLYSLLDSSWNDFLLPAGSHPKWINWPSLFKALEILWSGLSNPMIKNDSVIASSEFKLKYHQAMPFLDKAIPALVKNKSFLGNSETDISELCLNAMSIIDNLM